MSRVLLTPKRVGETKLYAFDFLSLLVGTQIVSSATTTASVYSGVDSNPSAIISGPGVVSNGRYVNQNITAGVAGVIYLLSVTATLSDATVVKISAFLSVLPNTL